MDLPSPILVPAPTEAPLTDRGRLIAAYITVRNLPDGGRGYAVMGAVIEASTGHAIESRCYANCPRSGVCPEHGAPLDHGRVTEPGPILRFNAPDGWGSADVGERVWFAHHGLRVEGLVVQKRLPILPGGGELVVLRDGPECYLHAFNLWSGQLSKLGTRGSIPEARARYLAHLAQYQAWRAHLDAGYTPDW